MRRSQCNTRPMVKLVSLFKFETAQPVVKPTWDSIDIGNPDTDLMP